MTNYRVEINLLFLYVNTYGRKYVPIIVTYVCSYMYYNGIILVDI